MEERSVELINSCNFRDVSPIMAELPYPAVQVQRKNPEYADLLSIDCCGQVSEFSAITQYINHENRLSLKQCAIAKTLLGIAIAEMVHLQKLSEMTLLLGGEINYTARYRDGRKRVWTPGYLKFSDDVGEILRINIEGEKNAIEQYQKHIRMIKDDHINVMLTRIIKDEEYHIFLLQTLLKGV